MHAGRLETSKRLQDTMTALADGRWRSTRDISALTGSMAVHSDIAGLRENNVEVETQRMGKRYYYRIGRE